MEGRLADYVKIRTIGRGNFGEALLVRHRSTGTECVLKRVGLSGLPAAKAQEAVQEGAVLQQLQHPNIVAFLGAFVDTRAECFCLLTAFCERGDLHARLNQLRIEASRLAEQSILIWFEQLSSAVAHVHSNSVLHRDLKPSNIFLTVSGATNEEAVAIGDFGISRTLGHTQELAMTAVGTPCYLSPEVCKGLPYSYKSDIWSLGCILYEMAALRCAFSPDHGSLEVLITQIVRASYQVPTRLATLYPLVIKKVRGILYVDPSKRPSAAACASWALKSLGSFGEVVHGAISGPTNAPVKGNTEINGSDHVSYASGFDRRDARGPSPCEPIRKSITRAELAAQILEKESGTEVQRKSSNAKEDHRNHVTRAELASRILQSEAQKRRAQVAWRDTEPQLLRGDEVGASVQAQRAKQQVAPLHLKEPLRAAASATSRNQPAKDVHQQYDTQWNGKGRTRGVAAQGGRDLPKDDSRGRAGVSPKRHTDTSPKSNCDEQCRTSSKSRVVSEQSRVRSNSCSDRCRSKSCDDRKHTAKPNLPRHVSLTSEVAENLCDAPAETKKAEGSPGDLRFSGVQREVVAAVAAACEATSQKRQQQQHCQHQHQQLQQPHHIPHRFRDLNSSLEGGIRESDVDLREHPGVAESPVERCPREQSQLSPRQAVLAARRERRVQSQRDFRGWLKQQRLRNGGQNGKAEFAGTGDEADEGQNPSGKHNGINYRRRSLSTGERCDSPGASIEESRDHDAVSLNPGSDGLVPMIKLKLNRGNTSNDSHEFLLLQPESKEFTGIAPSSHPSSAQLVQKECHSQQSQGPLPCRWSPSSMTVPMQHPGLLGARPWDTSTLADTTETAPLDSSSLFLSCQGERTGGSVFSVKVSANASTGNRSGCRNEVGDCSRPHAEWSDIVNVGSRSSSPQPSRMERPMERRCIPVQRLQQPPVTPIWASAPGVTAELQSQDAPLGRGVCASRSAVPGEGSVGEKLENLRCSLEEQMGTRRFQELYAALQRAGRKTVKPQASHEIANVVVTDVDDADVFRPAVATLVAYEREFFN